VSFVARLKPGPDTCLTKGCVCLHNECSCLAAKPRHRDTRRLAGCLFFICAEAAQDGNPVCGCGCDSGPSFPASPLIQDDFCCAAIFRGAASFYAAGRHGTPFFSVWCSLPDSCTLATVRWDMSSFVVDSGEEKSYSRGSTQGCERQQIIDKIGISHLAVSL
jgi:hypothetical protein